MAVLSHQSIVRRCGADEGRLAGPLVYEYYDERQVKTAAYDLRVGAEYYVDDPPQRASGRLKTRHLGREGMTLQIRANQVILVRTLESIDMPEDLVGHLSLKLDVLLDGIIMASQSQIDAGYKGPIFALLYNLSHDTVTLKRGQSLLRLEFEELDETTDAPYHGDFKPYFRLADVVPKRLTSSLESTNRKADDARSAVRRLLVGSIIAGAIAVLALVTQLMGPIQSTASDARSDAAAAQREIARLEEQVRDLRADLTLAQQATTTTTTKP